MNNQLRALDRIHRILKAYAAEIKANVSSGRTDIVLDAEKVIADLFDKIYGYELVRPEGYRRNYPAVDFVDESRCVAVEITATNTRQKAQRTVASFLNNRLNEKYKTIIVLILVYAPAFRNVDQLSHQLRSENVELRVMTLLDLTREIESLSLDEIDQIAEFLDQKIGYTESVLQADGDSAAAPPMSIDNLSDACFHVFQLSNLLPKEGLERIVFEHGLSQEQKHALIDLCEFDLILETDAVVKIHPHYQNNTDYVPAPNKCAFFLDSLWNYEESTHWDKLTWPRKKLVRRSLAQVFARAAELFPDSSADYAQKSAELWRSTQNYRDALTLEQKALKLIQSSERDSWNVARALHFTGDCQFELKNPELALEEWQRTLELCRHPLHASAPDLAIAYQNVGRALIEMKKFESAKSFLLDGLKIMEALRRKGIEFLAHPWMETIYDFLSTVYTGLDQITNAALCTQNALQPPAEQKNLWEVFVPLHLPLPMGLGVESFVSREKELAAIADQFQYRKVVYLIGYGGIGKTELAIQFGSRYTEGAVYFVRFHDNLTDTVTLGVAAGIDGMRDKTHAEAYREAMDRLARCQEQDLLIIDDVNVDPSSFEKDPVWQELMQLPMRFLITTRYSVTGAIEVCSLTNESLYRLFVNQGLELTINQMDDLIGAVNWHTLTVDLIARTMKSNPWLTGEHLLNILKMSKLPLGDIQQSSMAYSHEEEAAQIQAYLRVLYNVTKLSDSEKNLLRNMVLLPENGVDTKTLGVILDKKDMEALAQLINRGLLSFVKNTDLVTIHPHVRTTLWRELKPDDDSCKQFLDAVWKQYDPGQFYSNRILQYSELYSEAADRLPDVMGIWSFRAAVLCNMVGQAHKTLHYELQAASRQEQSIPASAELATTYSNLGLTYGDMGNHQNALEYQMKALAIREAILSPDDPALANSYNNIGHTYGNLGDHDTALQYILRAINICERVFPDDHPDLALSYYNAGMTYSELGDYCKGLEYQKKALEIREKIFPQNHPELALSYISIGTTYGYLGEHNMALGCKLKALQIYKQILPEDHPELSLTYNTVGSTYSDLGDHKKALDYKKKALAIQEKVLPSNHPELAATYNNLGSTYDYLGDHDKALEYTMKAMAIMEEAFPSDHPDLATSFNNLAATYGALGDHQKALEYHMKSMSIFEKVFPPDHPDLATAYNNVGYAYGELEQYSQALEYIEKALSIFEKSLPAGHPHIESTRKAVMMYQMMLDMSNSGVDFKNPLSD